jgi:hypothetical protein
MALSLKDAETDRLAREVAKLTGESLTEAVRKALAERLLWMSPGQSLDLFGGSPTAATADGRCDLQDGLRHQATPFRQQYIPKPDDRQWLLGIAAQEETSFSASAMENRP